MTRRPTLEIGALLLPCLLLGSGERASSQTTSTDIVARCAEAMGGRSAIEAIRTIRLVIRYPDHEYLVISEIARPNRLRTEGEGRYVLAFDGKRAALLETGSEQHKPVQMLEGEMVRDMEVDIGYYFPAFFDYPAQYLGREQSGGRDVHKLLVRLPLGAEMTYLVDATTYLPVSAAAKVEIEGKQYAFERSFLKYEHADGITYFRAFTYPPRPGATEGERPTATIERLEFNPSLADSRFDPAALRREP